MSLDQLKEKVRNAISKAKVKEAIDEIAGWAHENNQKQLSNDTSLLNGDLSTLNREKTLGLISGSDASIRQTRMTFQILSLLDGIESPEDKDKNPSPVKPKGSADKPKIYFSYAWGDDDETGESREKIVTDLYESLLADGYEVVRDKEDMEYKDLISNFMREIGKGDFIVVAISDKYLKSTNCMFEMYEIFRNAKLDKGNFREKIYPIRVESLKLSEPEVLYTYFDHWEKQEKKWADLILKSGTRIAPAQQERYKRVKAIASELGDFLDFLSDINSKSKAQLSKDNFEGIKKAIQARVSG